MNLDDVRRALPWYAAGALAADEADAVAAELRRSPELQRELREWQALGAAATAPRADEPEFRGSLSEVWAQVERHEQNARDATRRAQQRSLFEWLRTNLLAMPTAGRWALAAQFALVVVLAGALVVSQREPPTSRTLAGSAPTTTHGGVRLTVAFEPTATEADMRALIATLGAQVVAGPTAEQLYTLELPEHGGAAADAALGRLRAARGTVRFAAREGD